MGAILALTSHLQEATMIMKVRLNKMDEHKFQKQGVGRNNGARPLLSNVTQIRMKYLTQTSLNIYRLTFNLWLTFLSSWAAADCIEPTLPLSFFGLKYIECIVYNFK